EDRRRDGIERNLRRRPRLEARAAGEDLGSRVELDAVIAPFGRGTGEAGEKPGEGTAGLRERHGTEHVRRRPPRRDPEEGVVAAERNPLEVGGDPARIVLGPLAAAPQRRVAAGDDPDDLPGIRAEGRRTLARIEDAEPPARPRAGVDEP